MRLESVNKVQGGYLARLSGRDGQKTRLASSTIDGLLTSVLRELDFGADHLIRVRDLFVKMTDEEIEVLERRLQRLRNPSRPRQACRIASEELETAA